MDLQWLGICAALASNACTSLGLLFQEQSAKTEASMPVCRRRRLMLGLVLNIGSEVILSSSALALAPLSVLAPMGATNVVFNGVFLHFGVVGRQRKMRWVQWVVTLVLSAAIAVCALAGRHRDIVLSQILVRFVASPMRYVTLAVVCLTSALSLVDLCWEHSSTVSTLVAVALSGLTIVCFKITILSLVDWVNEWRVPPNAFLIVSCIVALPILAVFQLFMLNRALRGDARFILPTYTSLSMIGVMGYSVMLGEFEYTDPASLTMLGCSVALVVVCLFVLQRMASLTEDIVHPAVTL